MNKTDMQLKKDVEDELQWEPKVNAARIGVSARNGAVILTGEVDTYPEKWAAQDAAKRVGGVRSVAEDLTVKLLGGSKHMTRRSRRPRSAPSSGTYGFRTPSR